MPLRLLKNAEHVDKASNISPMRQGMMLRTNPVFGDLGRVLEITPISPFHAIINKSAASTNTTSRDSVSRVPIERRISSQSTAIIGSFSYHQVWASARCRSWAS